MSEVLSAPRSPPETRMRSSLDIASILVSDNSYSDADGNFGASDSLDISYSTDTPTLTISSDDLSLVAGETATIRFVFSEPVAGFDASDIGVTGGMLGTLSTSDNQTFTADFTPDANAEGTANISVADSSYADLDGNPGLGDSLGIVSVGVSVE